MSVALFVKKEEQDTAIYSIGGQNTMENRFCPLAASLSLVHLPHIYTHYEVNPNELEDVIRECLIIHAEMKKDASKWGIILENIDQVIHILMELRGRNDWQVSFG